MVYKTKTKDKTTKNTLIVVSADHGQIDVEGYVEIYKDKEIMDMLEMLIYEQQLIEKEFLLLSTTE